MVWAERIGKTIKGFVVLGIDLFTILSELNARVWELAASWMRDLDQFADDLKERLETKREDPGKAVSDNSSTSPKF